MHGDIRMVSDHVKTVLLKISFVSLSLVLCQSGAVISIHVIEQSALPVTFCWVKRVAKRNIAVGTTVTLKEYIVICRGLNEIEVKEHKGVFISCCRVPHLVLGCNIFPNFSLHQNILTSPHVR